MESKTVSIPHPLTTSLRLSLYIAAFMIPLAFNANQIVTGTLVNCLLFLAVTRLTRKDQIPVIILPSLGALAHGVLFGPQTIFLYFFLPFIWLGNYILIWAFTHFSKYNFTLKISAAAIAKYLLLYTAAFIYLRFRLVPPIFLTAMGIVQLVTALFGGVLSYAVMTITTRYDRH